MSSGTTAARTSFTRPHPAIHEHLHPLIRSSDRSVFRCVIQNRHGKSYFDPTRRGRRASPSRLEASGMSRSEAIRTALVESAQRLRGRHEIAGEAGVILQADEFLSRSVVIVAPTSQSARPASFRPQIEVDDQPTRVLVEQLCAQLCAAGTTVLAKLVGHLAATVVSCAEEGTRAYHHTMVWSRPRVSFSGRPSTRTDRGGPGPSTRPGRVEPARTEARCS